MKKNLISKKSIVVILLLILVVSNFGFSFAYWASSVSTNQGNADSAVRIGQWDFEDTALVVATYRFDHAYVLSLTEETVQVSDKTAVEAALAEYGLLSDEAKAELLVERDLLLSLLAEIIAFENSELLDFEGYAYDQGLTGTVDINGRTWYGNAVYISNDPAYDVWNDTRSLALKMGAYFESQDLFINGIDKITIYHGALNYNNGASFAFKVEYELDSNPGVWLTLQEGGLDLIVDVISGTPLSYSEINVNITEALNIRFTPVISNTSDYINLDDIRIFEHIVSSNLEVETFRTIYASALALNLGTVEISDKSSVTSALSAFDLLSVEAQASLGVEKALLDSLLVQIELLEDFQAATQAVILSESTLEQSDLDQAQVLVNLLPAGAEKTALQSRIDAVQAIIDSIEMFLLDYADVLALTVGTVQISDKSDIEDAIDAYLALSLGAQTKLNTEKALLDSLLVEINNQVPTETLVLEFRTNHAIALALTVGTVEISDELIIIQALNAYELLTPAAKLELAAEKALLDSLILEISLQEATQAVVIAETSYLQADLDSAQVLVSALPSGTEKTLLQNRLDVVQDTIDAVLLFRSDYADLLLLTVETVQITDKVAIEDALSAYGLLSDEAKNQLLIEKDLLLVLLAEIIAFENSEYIDFEGYAYDQGLTGTVSINGRTWYGNAVYISNDPVYDVWNDTRSLALKMGAYFESRDPFINGIDQITIYHGALNYNNGTSFAFKVEYELQTNPGVWLTLQEGGSDLIIDVISATPLTYSEINVNITEAIDIRFTPVIGNTTDYINLDDIRIYEHVVPSALEVETYLSLYAGVLALTVETVDLSHQDAVASALSTYDILSVQAQNALLAEKALLDSLWTEIEWQEDLFLATTAVEVAENSKDQIDLDQAQILVTALPAGTEKTALQARIDAVQFIIDAVDLFRTNHADVLILTVETVEVTDKPEVEDALYAYSLLSAIIKAELASEKALLDSLLIEINSQTPTEALVLEFETNHAVALSLTISTVQISDAFIVEQALAAYELLTPEAKDMLITEKALLDSLIDEITLQEATEAVVIAESSNLQVDHDSALVLVLALPNGSEKTALQARLDAVQVIINTQAADYVEGLISAIPSSGSIALTDEASIVSARTAYEALTTVQKALVTNISILIAAENELSNLVAATNAVITAETSNLQADHDAAQVLVTALPNGTPKTDLQNRLNAVQDIIDVEAARAIIESYFALNDVAVSSLNNNTIKQTAFLARANQIVNGLGVTINVNSFVRVTRTNSTYNITISKNGASVTITVSVTFFRG
ncbi:MAG: hypothetical protein KKH92_10070 [Firmicutes bacterium]|nr:hypothetical protein [Bacillota bacterium]